MMAKGVLEPLPHEAAINDFLRRHQWGSWDSATLLRGGANNRVYRVGEGADAVVLKVHFQRADELWNRYVAERKFYEIARARTPQSVPRLLGWDDTLRVSCFEWIEGETFGESGVRVEDVRVAGEFIRQLQVGGLPEDLDSASEACFDGREHGDMIEKRLHRLRTLEENHALQRMMQSFVREALVPRWEKIKKKVEALPACSRRCVSPSDFGFHNALRCEGRPIFFDFEYAGIDDPAKLLGDFFWQPAVPVNWGMAREFLQSVGDALGEEKPLRERTAALFPALGIKWCCIILNDFVRGDRDRRRFALGDEGEVDRLRSQLSKAQGKVELLDGAIQETPFS